MEPTTAQPTQTAQPYKILLIEDEQFISELYTRALQKAGYAIDVETDGERAHEKARTNTYDLILLDIMIPSINGIDILYRLKDPQLQPPLRSKVIITTNLDQKEETRTKIEQLADGYLIKAEITPKELVRYVQSISS